ncbi:hypothetical protein ACSDQ9_05790 [Aestuariimicrobium soli]|uniref:hypothetical protein n=1 Tax=Aestuariimicrobium soli TaxID=2035834 RepID=UPI003EBB726F
MIASHPVGHMVASTGVTGAHGNATTTYAPAVERMVYGIAPTSSTEPKTVGKDRVVVQLEVFSPWAAAPADRLVIGTRIYDVVGESEDLNRGPFGYQPGYVINLVRADG